MEIGEWKPCNCQTPQKQLLTIFYCEPKIGCLTHVCTLDKCFILISHLVENVHHFTLFGKEIENKYF